MKTPFVSWIMLMGVFIYSANADCDKGCDLPINVYEQLKCTPKYDNPTDCCPKEYDCSHIFNRPNGTCQLRGKLYKLGEFVPDYELAENCLVNCRCIENSVFQCLPPHTVCHEYYVPDYPKNNCYLRYALDSCCATDQNCEPIDKVPKCEVNGKIYKEGERFAHPEAKCTKCLCTKDFNGNLAAPVCQKKNCTTEIKYTKEIIKHCAPYYIGGTCCPSWWICPRVGGEYIPAPTVSKLRGQCKFEDKIMDIGSKYLYQDQHSAKIICECIVPPFLSCFEENGE